MARPLHERSSSEPTGSITVGGSRVFPSPGTAAPCSLCEQTAAGRSQPARCQGCVSPRANRCPSGREPGSDCGCGPRSRNCVQRLCPESFTTGETTAYGVLGGLVAQSGTGNIRAPLLVGVEADIPADEQPLADDGHLEHEIAVRLRRIGDQMNELYLQRRQVGERRWLRPLRWQLTRFIYEILTALYNPLVEILPHN